MVLTAVSDSCTGLHSGSTQWYIEPHICTKVCKQSFPSNGLRIWNTMPANLHDITDTAKLKRSLKSYFLI